MSETGMKTAPICLEIGLDIDNDFLVAASALKHAPRNALKSGGFSQFIDAHREVPSIRVEDAFQHAKRGVEPAIALVFGLKRHFQQLISSGLGE